MNNKNLLILFRIIIAGTFIFSAISKLMSIGVFEITLIDQGIFTVRENAALFSRILIGIELSIGLLFLQPFNIKKVIAPITILLIIIFSGQLIYLMFKGDASNCGCFGNIIKMSPLESLFKNIILLILTIYVYLKSEKLNQNKSFLFIIPIAVISIVFIISPMRSIKNFEFSKYTHFQNEGRVDLTRGDKLLGVFDLECDHCQEAAKEIGEMQRKVKNFPEFYVLFFGEGNVSVDSFNVITKTKFAYQKITVDEFFNLIGNSPPRIYWLEDGQVKKYWDKDFVGNITHAFELK